MTSFDAHSRLVVIHLFVDGNGHIARLVMNVLRLRGGHPLVALRSEDQKPILMRLTMLP
ncbi:Fic family protein [Nitrospira sp. CMX1]|nr:Fic family protein [Nitrospira sp.]